MKKQIMYRKLSLLCLVSLLFLAGAVLSVYGQATRQKGDVNGDGLVNIIDAMLVATGAIPQSGGEAADVNCDNTINILDALLVARYSAQLITQFPCSFTPTPTPSPTGVSAHLDNPFADAQWYVNPDWSAKATAGGGARIARFNTAVWLNRIADVSEGRGLAGHLDTALTQEANLFVLVLNNIPGKDCTTPEPASELLPADVNRYKTEFIDPVVSILGKPQYAGIRIVTIIESDAVPNLLTSFSQSRCSQTDYYMAYIQSIQYAINQLYVLPNVYLYMDIARSAWLGWSDNFDAAVTLYTNILQNTIPGLVRIDGFASNICDYVPVEEPFLPDPQLTLTEGGLPVKASFFFEWNNYFDELSYVTAMQKALVARGFSSNIGMLIDTSRNGWGGPVRPTAVSTSTDTNIYVNQSRIDRRFHRGNWCNQVAGLGPRPTANPAPLVDAFVWIKPPGESDGISEPDIPDPTNPYNIYHTMCGPDNLNIYCACGITGAMHSAPHAGNWHQVQFENLLRNAYPPLE